MQRTHRDWNIELDLRSIKSTMQMDDLRCKTPELVRKEVWTHVLAYNLIRTVIAQAASKHGLEPRSISFKGTIQTLEAFQPVIELRGSRDSEFRENLYEHLLACIASHRVGDRPGRFEPRKKKRRFKLYDFLRKPRAVVKQEMAKELGKSKCHSIHRPKISSPANAILRRITPTQFAKTVRAIGRCDRRELLK